MPDTSMFSDLDIDYNRSQLKRALIGAVILQMEFHAVVIPNISYISEETFPLSALSVLVVVRVFELMLMIERNLILGLKLIFKDGPAVTGMIISRSGKQRIA